MKIFKNLITLIALAFAFASCEDDSVKATLKSNVAANELTTPSKAAYVLLIEDKDKTMETFKWSATDFGFKSSVTYKLQLDLASGDFSDAALLATTTSLEAAVNTGAINDLLLDLGLNPDEATDVKIRVVSSVNEKVPAVISASKTIKITAYATSFPPIWGMGDGLKGWGPWPDNAVEWQSSEFKKYETVAYFTTGKAFRFFAQLDWNPLSYNYPFFTTVDPLFTNANDGDSNLKIAGASGWYKVNVNLKDKIVTALPVAEPVLFMMGDAVNGWGPWNSKEVKMTYVKPGVFVADATFKAGAFRFFAQADWGPTSYNYPYFASVATDFENANDGDKNFKFIGAAGTRKVTVDLIAKTVTLGNPPLPKLFMMGDALNGWGPWNDKEVAMTYKSPGVFEATATFTTDKAFRFFAQADWGPTSYNYPYFTTVDANFVNAADGDSNFKFVGTSGSHTINVNLTTKVVTFN
jgi:starch-binding outer membrane protein SusE/F